MNLTIPDAAVHLSVSETRLRKTLADGDFAVRTEMRQTRTGLRKTTFVPGDTLEALRQHYLRLAAPDMQANEANAETIAAPDMLGAERAETFVREASASYGGYGEAGHARGAQQEAAEEAASVQGCAPSLAETAVPVEQFQALLYQHNVLREEFSRVSRYLEECDTLLEEMIHTIASLEERTRGLEAQRSAPRLPTNPLSGALRSVSSGLQHALQARSRDKDRPIGKPATVYYAGVLSRG